MDRFDDIEFQVDDDTVVDQRIPPSEDNIVLVEEKSTFAYYIEGKYGMSLMTMVDSTNHAQTLSEELEVRILAGTQIDAMTNLVPRKIQHHDYTQYANYVEYLGCVVKKNLSFENMLRGLSHYAGGDMYVRIGNGQVCFVMTGKVYSSSDLILYAQELFRKSDIELSVDSDSVDLYMIQSKKVKAVEKKKMDTSLQAYLSRGLIPLDFDALLSKSADILANLLSNTQDKYIPGMKRSLKTGEIMFTTLSVGSAKCYSNDVNYPFGGIWPQEPKESKVKRLLSFFGIEEDSPYYEETFKEILETSSIDDSMLRDTFVDCEREFQPFNKSWFVRSKNATITESSTVESRIATLSKYFNRYVVYFPIGNVSYWLCGVRRTAKVLWNLKSLEYCIKIMDRFFVYLRHLTLFSIMNGSSEQFAIVLLKKLVPALGKNNISQIIGETLQTNLKMWFNQYQIKIEPRSKYAPPTSSVILRDEEDIVLDFDLSNFTGVPEPIKIEDRSYNNNILEEDDLSDDGNYETTDFA